MQTPLFLPNHALATACALENSLARAGPACPFVLACEIGPSLLGADSPRISYYISSQIPDAMLPSQLFQIPLQVAQQPHSAATTNSSSHIQQRMSSSQSEQTQQHPRASQPSPEEQKKRTANRDDSLVQELFASISQPFKPRRLDEAFKSAIRFLSKKFGKLFMEFEKFGYRLETQEIHCAKSIFYTFSMKNKEPIAREASERVWLLRNQFMEKGTIRECVHFFTHSFAIQTILRDFVKLVLALGPHETGVLKIIRKVQQNAGLKAEEAAVLLEIIQDLQ